MSDGLSLDIDTSLTVAGHVKAVEVGDDLVVVDELNATAYGLNSVAAYVWMSLAEGLTLTAIVDELAPVFDAPVEQIVTDVSALAREFGKLGVVTSDGPHLMTQLVAEECVADLEDVVDGSHSTPEGASTPTFDDRYLAAPPNY